MIGSITNYKGEKNGLLQMFNFKGPITRTQLERFHALSGFLGSCIDNIFALIRTLQTLTGVQLIIDQNEDAAALAYDGIYERLRAFRQFDIPITLMRETVRKMKEQND